MSDSDSLLLQVTYREEADIATFSNGDRTEVFRSGGSASGGPALGNDRNWDSAGNASGSVATSETGQYSIEQLIRKLSFDWLAKGLCRGAWNGVAADEQGVDISFNDANNRAESVAADRYDSIEDRVGFPVVIEGSAANSTLGNRLATLTDVGAGGSYAELKGVVLANEAAGPNVRIRAGHGTIVGSQGGRTYYSLEEKVGIDGGAVSYEHFRGVVANSLGLANSTDGVLKATWNLEYAKRLATTQATMGSGTVIADPGAGNSSFGFRKHLKMIQIDDGLLYAANDQASATAIVLSAYDAAVETTDLVVQSHNWNVTNNISRQGAGGDNLEAVDYNYGLHEVSGDISVLQRHKIKEWLQYWIEGGYPVSIKFYYEAGDGTGLIFFANKCLLSGGVPQVGTPGSPVTIPFSFRADADPLLGGRTWGMAIL